MPFPANWPPATGSGRKSIRIYTDGIATNDYADNAFMFADLPSVGAGCPRKPDVYPLTAIRVCNDGTADIFVTFDGTTTHGVLRPAEKFVFKGRVETGMAVRTDSTHIHPLFAAYRVEGW